MNVVLIVVVILASGLCHIRRQALSVEVGHQSVDCVDKRDMNALYSNSMEGSEVSQTYCSQSGPSQDHCTMCSCCYTNIPTPASTLSA